MDNVSREKVLNVLKRVTGKKINQIDLDSDLKSQLAIDSVQIVELFAALWCLDNYILLSNPNPHPWYTVFYEKLVLDREFELKNIFNAIGEKIPKNALDRMKKPSGSVFLNTDFKTENRLIQWKNSFTRNQVKKVLNVLDLFDFNFYSEDLEPDYKSIN